MASSWLGTGAAPAVGTRQPRRRRAGHQGMARGGLRGSRNGPSTRRGDQPRWYPRDRDQRQLRHHALIRRWTRQYQTKQHRARWQQAMPPGSPTPEASDGSSPRPHQAVGTTAQREMAAAHHARGAEAMPPSYPAPDAINGPAHALTRLEVRPHSARRQQPTRRKWTSRRAQSPRGCSVHPQPNADQQQPTEWRRPIQPTPTP